MSWSSGSVPKGSSKGGQVLLLGVIIVALLLLGSLVSLRRPSPKVVVVRDWLQPAQLLHTVRAAIAEAGHNESRVRLYVQQYLSTIYTYNHSYKMNLPRTLNYSVSVGDNYYEVELTLEHYDRISLRIEWNYTILGEMEKGIEVSITSYRQVYKGPWGSITIYPNLRGSVKRTGIRSWRVLVPHLPYSLRDEFGVEIVIGG